MGVRDGPATGAKGGAAAATGSAGVTGAIGEDGAVETELDWRRREDRVGTGGVWRWAGIGEAIATGPPCMIVDFG